MTLLSIRAVSKPGSNRRLAAVAAFGLVYFVLCRLSLAFCYGSEGVAGIWPPAGIALAAMLLLGRSHRGAMLLAIGMATIAANLLSSRPLSLCFALAIPNLTLALAGEWSYRLLAGRSSRLDNLRRAAVLVFVVSPVSAALAAASGAVLFHLLGGADLWHTFRGWWIADNLGILSTAPVVLLSLRSQREREPASYYVETGLFFLFGSVLAIWVFSVSSPPEIYDLRRPYLLIALHAWAALRLRARHAAQLALLTSLIAIGFTVHGRGLFALSKLGAFEQLLDAELYLMLVSSTSLLISALCSERARHQRRLVQAAVARAELDRLHHLQLVTDAMPAFISYIDPDGRYRFSSKYYQSISPVPQDQIIGRHVRDIIGEQNFRHAEPHLRRAMQGHKVRFEYEFVTRDGSQQNVLVSYLPHFDATGRLCGVYCLANDVTQQKAVEEQLRQYQQRLEQAARLNTMGELAGGLAHELNQPLSAIHNYAKGCTRRLNGAAPDLVELKMALEQISEEASRAGSIIAGLRRHFSRRSLERESVVLAEITRRVLEICQHELRRSTIATSFSDTTDAAVLIDTVQIQQVLLNLVRNACEAMRGVSGLRQLSIDVRQLGKDQIQISVSDTGIGFRPEEEPRLFEKFYTTKDDGLGMGLPISRSIIEAHGGRLWAERNAEGGATFHFTLPVDC